MRLILDTNVLMSGVFFAGPPAQILEAWSEGKVQLVLSVEILQEYDRVGRELTRKYPGVDTRVPSLRSSPHKPCCTMFPPCLSRSATTPTMTSF